MLLFMFQIITNQNIPWNIVFNVFDPNNNKNIEVNKTNAVHIIFIKKISAITHPYCLNYSMNYAIGIFNN